MAKAAVRCTIDSYLNKKNTSGDLVTITGKGLSSVNDPILQGTTLDILEREYGVNGRVDDSNQGRIVVDLEILRVFVSSKSWRWHFLIAIAFIQQTHNQGSRGSFENENSI
jgi:hypothetical protein